MTKEAVMAKRRGMNFEGMLGKGENPRGYVGQTANGTTRTGQPGWNKDQPYEWPMVPAEGVWNGDRSGE